MPPKVVWTPDPNGGLEVWEKPIPGKRYIIGADVALGVQPSSSNDDPDYSVAEVLDSNLNQCAEWVGRIEPFSFGDELAKLGWWYNEAELCPEYQGPGIGTVRRLQELDYWNLYVWRPFDDKDPAKLGHKIAWDTSQRTRQLIIGYMKKLILRGEVTVHSNLLLEQMKNFVKDYWAQPQAAEGFHDDALFAFMIGAFCLNVDASLFEPRSREEYREAVQAVQPGTVLWPERPERGAPTRKVGDESWMDF